MRKSAFILALVCCLTALWGQQVLPSQQVQPVQPVQQALPSQTVQSASIGRAGLPCGLKNGGGSTAVAVADLPTDFSVRPAENDQWRCERACNSDLNLPRVASQTAPASAVRLLPRSAYPNLRTALPQTHAARGDERKRTSSFLLQILAAAPRSVDSHVLRLGRLII